MNYRLKTSDGRFLSSLDVFKDGIPLQVTKWGGIMAHLGDYQFRINFVESEEGAWLSISDEAAEQFRTILHLKGIKSELVPVQGQNSPDGA
jgi:hypothetical protein